MDSPSNLTRQQVIAQVVSEMDGLTPLEEMVDRVLQRKPSRAKNPRTPIRGDIRLEAFSLNIVFGDTERKIVAPAASAMRGVRFRHTLTDLEISNRTLIWEESDHIYLPGKYKPPDFRRKDLELIDAGGRVVAEEQKLTSWSEKDAFGPVRLQASGRKIAALIRQHRVKAGDAFLFVIERFNPPRWRLEYEPQAQRDQAAIDRRNRELVDLLHQMLEESTAEYIDHYVAVRSALFQMADPAGYPGDPWVTALQADGRMTLSYMGIVYADGSRATAFDHLLDSLLDDSLLVLEDTLEDELALADPAPLPPLPAGAATRVYTCKVSAAYRSGLWRRIEVLGGDMLADLNSFLVDQFKHDDDHMGGFWKLVRRGNSKRVREVELATIDPFGGGKGSELRLAELDLHEGDELKWIYDFGDWYEYKLKLETVAEPETPPDEKNYPRVVAANKPRLFYCTSCLAQGRQTVAQWSCWDCSREQNENVMLCEDCMQLGEHEDHYLEEWVY